MPSTRAPVTVEDDLSNADLALTTSVQRNWGLWHYVALWVGMSNGAWFTAAAVSSVAHLALMRARRARGADARRRLITATPKCPYLPRSKR